MSSTYIKTKTTFGEGSEEKLGKFPFEELTDSDEQAALLLRTFNLERHSNTNMNINEKSEPKIPQCD